MRIALLHSSDAGDAVSPDVLRRAIEGAGHRLVGLFEPDVEIDAILARGPELVVAAGGDGTVWRAATAVHGRPVPLAILPLGTANNVATSLGVGGSIEDLAAGWHSAHPRPIDLGLVRGARGESRFVEGVGGGLVSRAIATLSTRDNGESGDPDSKIADALRRYRELLAGLLPSPVELLVDGEAISGEFLLVEVLNIRSVGPNLVLAPEADPSDGLLEVVTAGEEHRSELDRYLRHRIEGRQTPPSLPTRQARAVEIQGWEEMHLDDEVRLGTSIGTVSVGIEPGALLILVPDAGSKAADGGTSRDS